MSLEVVLEQAWQDVESAYRRGYVVNESMLAFVLWKALHERRPDLQVTYEAQIAASETCRPELLIWRGGETASVLFAAILEFDSDGSVDYGSDVAKLQGIGRKPKLAVPVRDARSGEVVAREMDKSQDFAIGFFAVAPRAAGAVTCDTVAQSLSEEERAIFHFAFGSIGHEPSAQSLFEYFAPGSVP